MTSKVLLYRPRSKRHIVAAFTAAAAIHLSAVAIASLRHEAPIAKQQNQFSIVVIDPEIEPPPPISPPLFVEPASPARLAPRKSQVVPIRPVGQTPRAVSPNAKVFALSAPRPEYPYEERSRNITGSGVAVISVDPTSGWVMAVRMEQSIGSPILDNSTISAFKRWRFNQGTARKIRVPITFTLTGAQY